VDATLAALAIITGPESGTGTLEVGIASLAPTGDLAIGNNVVVNLDAVTELTLIDTKAITVGTNSKVQFTTFVLKTGYYAATGGDVIFAGAGSITTASGANKCLAIGTSSGDITTNFVKLYSKGGATTEFTAAAGTAGGQLVEFSADGIKIPASDTGGASLSVPGSDPAGGIELKGSSGITLGGADDAAKAGQLIFANGGVLKTFTGGETWNATITAVGGAGVKSGQPANATAIGGVITAGGAFTLQGPTSGDVTITETSAIAGTSA
jgi:hypothetical protein